MTPNRRAFLAGLAAAVTTLRVLADGPRQLVAGQVEAAGVGTAVLAAGGNAVDAIVAAALAAGVAAVPQTGIGGYGGHLVVAGLAGGKVAAIDFNTTDPAALTPDYFKANEQGGVKGDANTYGWRAVGMPGVPAGLQLALDKYETKKLADVIQPAIKLARDGFTVGKAFAAAVAAGRPRLAQDPGSAKLFLPGGEPLREGAKFQNPDLAKLLEALAEAGSVTPFYRGQVAETIVAAFKANGGLVTAADLAAYKAEVEPLVLDWKGHTIHTPPPTSGGVTVLQTLAALKELGGDGTAGPAFVEALRVAWTDRLALIGDPAHGEVPVKRLLSDDYARQTAERVRAAVRDRKPVEGKSDGRSAGGTVHLNAIDATGLTVALTFTHGGYFGANVAVDGLGLVLGHGVSRFDPRPGRPNSPGPGKRPLHNMCPTVVTRGGAPVLAVGATGGRRIVNAVANVLAYRLGDGLALDAAVKAPRIHTEGDRALIAEPNYPHREALTAVGYSVTNGSVATLQPVQRDTKSGGVSAAAR